MRPLARGIVAAILVGLSLVIAAPAAADEADCAPTYLANSGRELFEIDDVYLPPALRGFPADCASRISDEPFDDGTGISFAYVLLYTDVDFAEYTAILRAFERDGWIDASFPDGDRHRFDGPRRERDDRRSSRRCRSRRCWRVPAFRVRPGSTSSR